MRCMWRTCAYCTARLVGTQALGGHSYHACAKMDKTLGTQSDWKKRLDIDAHHDVPITKHAITLNSSHFLNEPGKGWKTTRSPLRFARPLRKHLVVVLPSELKICKARMESVSYHPLMSPSFSPPQVTFAQQPPMQSLPHCSCVHAACADMFCVGWLSVASVAHESALDAPKGCAARNAPSQRTFAHVRIMHGCGACSQL